MNLVDVFNALLVVYLVLSLVALVRLRPATLIFGGNQILTVRALALATEYGQPHSQAFLPANVYRHDSLQIAAALFTIQAVLLALFVLWPMPPEPAPAPIPDVPRWLRWVLGLYFIPVIFASRTIFTHDYTDPERWTTGFNLSGFHALLASLFLFAVARRVRLHTLLPLAGFALVLGLFFLTDFSKGSTGLATGYVVTAAVLFFREERRPLRRWVLLGSAMISVVLLATVVRGVRANLHTEGLEAVVQFSETVGRQEQQTKRNAEGLEAFANGVQYAAHVLECIALYEAGASREWRSIYLPLEYTLKPSFLVGPLGLDRPKEAAWELGEYYIHGGGIFVLGELYWNGGYFCVVVVLAGILWFSRRCDIGSRTSALWLMLLCEFSPNLVQGIGYGFAQVSRGALNGMTVLLVYQAAQVFMGRRPGPPPPATHPARI